MSDDKSYIIDPLTLLCKLALLNFMPEGTKLGINQHILCIQEYNYYQWIERIRNGDNRKDISNIDAPLLKAIKWYIIEGPDKAEMNSEMIKSIHIITSFSIKGLQKLQNTTYGGDRAIRIVLQYFINLLRTAINDTWDEENIIKNDTDNNIVSNKIKYNFEDHTINYIAKMFADINKIENSKDNITAIVDCVHKLLINRDYVFVKLMKDINTIL